MSDIGVAEIPVDEDERPLPPPAPPVRNALVDGRILPTLLQLAWPNAIAFSADGSRFFASGGENGNLWVGDTASARIIGSINLNGTTHPLPGPLTVTANPPNRFKGTFPGNLTLGDGFGRDVVAARFGLVGRGRFLARGLVGDVG